MDELWKPIPNTDYAVSNTGKVASMKKGWRVLKPCRNGNGYPCVFLYDGSGSRNVRIHYLVASAFIGPRPTPKHQINHIDGVRTNPHAENLEWVTQSGNQRHRFDVLKHGAARGEAHGMSTLTEMDVREIRRRCAAGESQRQVAADCGISQSNVCLITKGKAWGWVV